ncbi:MAG: hypothetical protein Unbinned3329contig1000_5 [Prokaryotic dsDNA virus sp.]|jgi:hypothetical protein|nr:MAG: hypothetical protein Unbinned3329contig1000_5 [Prokaryotic dsDNA virus sp.]
MRNIRAIQEIIEPNTITTKSRTFRGEIDIVEMSKVLNKICLELESVIYYRRQLQSENSSCNEGKPDEILEFSQCLLNDIEKWKEANYE